MSNNGMPMIIPDNNPKGSMLTPTAHATKALTMEHFFQTTPNLPLDVQYASLMSTENIQQSRVKRMKRDHRLKELADISEHLDKAIWQRMSDSVNVAAATACLGLLSVLTFLLRWPDWQMTTLYTKVFKVAGIVEPFNIYPLAKPKAEISLTRMLETEGADVWNTKLNNDNKYLDYDTDVYDTAQDQLDRRLLSEALTKEHIDYIFGRGRWKGIRRQSSGNTVKSAVSAILRYQS